MLESDGGRFEGAVLAEGKGGGEGYGAAARLVLGGGAGNMPPGRVSTDREEPRKL